MLPLDNKSKHFAEKMYLCLFPQTPSIQQAATAQESNESGNNHGNANNSEEDTNSKELVTTMFSDFRDVTINAPNAPEAPLKFHNDEAVLQRQRERKKLIADVCEKRRLEIGGNFLYTDTFRHIYVIDDEQLLFCYIPKVGCSNWKRVLMVLDGKRDVTDDITSREAHAHNGMTILGKLTKEEQEYRLNNYRKVMFVREPLSRVVSAYKNKFEDLNVYRAAPRVFHHYARQIVTRYRENPSDLAKATGENVTWAEFVKYLTNKGERQGFDRHWKEMYKLCSPCQINYDFVGKLEHAGVEADFVLQYLNLTQDVKFPGRENSHPTNVSTSTAKYFDEFSSKRLKALWHIYKTDYELFGYEKPSYITWN